MIAYTEEELRKIVREEIKRSDMIKEIFEDMISTMNRRDEWIRINNDYDDRMGYERMVIDTSIHDKQIENYRIQLESLRNT